MNNIIEEECVSTLEAVKKKYTWRIKNFSNWPKSSTGDLTSDFSIKVLDADIKCHVKLTHAFADDECDYARKFYVNTDEVVDELGLYITFDGKEPLNATEVCVKVLVYDNRENVYNCIERSERIYGDNTGKRAAKFIWDNFLKHSFILNPENNLLSKDELKIVFEFIVPVKDVEPSGKDIVTELISMLTE